MGAWSSVCADKFVLKLYTNEVGDKSNHVATIHLPQMLYLWPYITFFSIPLTYPYLVQGSIALIGALPGLRNLEPNLMFRRPKFLPRAKVMIPIVALALVVVRYNTIIHPFTRADNRHYTFYVFRLLLRHPSIKFLVTPIYIIAAWSIIQALGAPATLLSSGNDSKMSPELKRIAPVDKAAPPPEQPLRINHASAGEGNTVTFVLVWICTSMLQLVTAPLVEPRYFILPWIMWRLRVPSSCAPTSMKEGKDSSKKGSKQSRVGRLKQVLWDQHDHRLWLETAWFLAINLVTGWVFLHKGFEWKQEPGVVQRFMW